MFQGFSIKSKKTFFKAPSKKTNKEKKASLETTRGSELSESFSERFNNLGVNESSGSNSLITSNKSKSI